MKKEEKQWKSEEEVVFFLLSVYSNYNYLIGLLEGLGYSGHGQVKRARELSNKLGIFMEEAME